MTLRIINKITHCVQGSIVPNITGNRGTKTCFRMASTSKCLQGAMAWIDLELTGLDTDTNHILEVACLVSDEDVNIIGEEFHVIVHQPESILSNMNAWNTRVHGKTGLTVASQESKVTVQDAEILLLAHLKKYTAPNRCLMAGNSVYMDRIFINKYMPSINKHLHYRLIDVSTIKELIRIWKPEVLNSAPKKTVSHQAMTDIKQSMNELKHYRKFLF